MYDLCGGREGLPQKNHGILLYKLKAVGFIRVAVNGYRQNLLEESKQKMWEL